MCFLCVFCVCFLSVFSCCVFSLCFLLCVFSSLCFFLSSLCFQYVLSVCVFCPCFLSGFAFLSINFDIILLWSGLADQLLFADINSQLIWLQYKYKILTRYFGLSGSPASSFFMFTPIPGEMIQFDEHILQMGWNHQLDQLCLQLLGTEEVWTWCPIASGV